MAANWVAENPSTARLFNAATWAELSAAISALDRPDTPADVDSAPTCAVDSAAT